MSAPKIIATLTRDSFPETVVYRGACTEPGCPEKPFEYRDTPNGAAAYLRGWFRDHVILTGHTVTVEEVG